MRYRLVGVDLDGTLIHGGRISVRNQQAIRAAQAAGSMVVPCTGRGWREAQGVLRDYPEPGLGVFVSGAMVMDVAAGDALNLAILEPAMAVRIVEHFFDEPEAVLIYRDRAQVGHDYLVTGRGSLSANTQWWFERTGVDVHFQEKVSEDDVRHTVRVGVVATEPRMAPLTAAVREAFGEQVIVQAFAAVPSPDPEQSVHVLEVFPAGVDKWRGMAWLAEANDIGMDEVAVIGDEINDVSMVASAGCGIAMGNAIDEVKQVARHVTEPCEEDGVAAAIDALLEGRWT